MSNSMTNRGQEYALYGTATPNGGLANLITAIRLYAVGSTPNKNGTGFNQVASGNGYPVGGFAVSRANWTLVLLGLDQAIRLGDISLTAAGGPISNIAGAYAVDGAGNVLCWWERAAGLTLNSGDVVLLDDLTLKAL